MNSIDSFLLGIKPALYENTKSKRFCEELPHLMEKYPYLDENIDLFYGPDFYLFFQDEEMKNTFLAAGAKPRTVDFDKALGLALGFPPKAVDFYCYRGKDDPKIGIHYAGIHFSSAPVNLYENATWLWELYRHQDVLHVRVDSVMIPVEFGDTYKLERLQGQLLQPSIATA